MNPVNTLWVVLMEAGFVGYVVSLVLLVWRGLDGAGRINRRPLVVFGSLAILCFALWIVGLHQA